MSPSPFMENECTAIRSNFTHLNTGHVYLNHAAVRPVRYPKREKRKELPLQQERDGSDSHHTTITQWMKMDEIDIPLENIFNT